MIWFIERKRIFIVSQRPLIIIFFLLLFFPLGAFSRDYSNGLNVGVMGAEISSEKGFAKGYYFGHFFDFIHQADFGFGLDLSPLYCSWNMKDVSDLSITFINGSVFYDFFPDEDFVLGPFTTAHALENNKPDFFCLQSGVLFSIRQFDDNSILCFNYVNVELGYTFSNRGSNAFYAQVGIDALGALTILGWGKQTEVEDYNKTGHSE